MWGEFQSGLAEIINLGVLNRAAQGLLLSLSGFLPCLPLRCSLCYCLLPGLPSLPACSLLCPWLLSFLLGPYLPSFVSSQLSRASLLPSSSLIGSSLVNSSRGQGSGPGGEESKHFPCLGRTIDFFLGAWTSLKFRVTVTRRHSLGWNAQWV